MGPIATVLTDRPRIRACGISRLSNLFLNIAAEYNDHVKLRVTTRSFEDIVREIDAAGAERPDVMVVSGSNGVYLKSRLSLPVIVINPTGFDVMHALAYTRRNVESVALVTHGDTPEEVRRFVAAYDMDVVSASYISRQDAESCALDLRDRGVGVVVGPGLVTDLATQAGMNVVFLYSRGLVRAAFDIMLEVVQATRRKALCRQRLDNLLQHLHDGAVALDAQGCVEAINQRLATVLGIEAEQTIGQPPLSIASNLLGLLSDTDGDTLGIVQGVNYVIRRGPLTSTGIGAAGGTVLTFQEFRAVERLDRTLCSRQHLQQLSACYRLEDLMGESLAMERVRMLMCCYAKSDAIVPALGESGTDKEMVAQGTYQLSAWRNSPFVAISCGAFLEALLESGLFGYEEGAFTGARKGGKTGLTEAAHRGTLSLDEIGKMPLPLQNRLLRVLQEHEVVQLGSTEPTRVDIRMVAVTHRALADAVEADTFHADLYYRLDILSIGLPSLCERPDDVMPLTAELFVQAACHEPRLLLCIADTEDVVRVLTGIAEPLRRYAWVGSVRELQSVVEQIAVELAYTEDASAVTQDVLRLIASEVSAHAAPGKPAALTLRERSRGVGAGEICAAPAVHGGDRDAACTVLGISKMTLWQRLQKVASIR